LKEFSGEEKRAESLMLQLEGQVQTQILEPLVDCGDPSAAKSLLQHWMRSPDAFCDAIRQDLDCNNDHMVSKMEFRRWSKDGVLAAALKSISVTGAVAPTTASEPAIAPIDSPTPALAALEIGCTPVLFPPPNPEPVAQTDSPTRPDHVPILAAYASGTSAFAPPPQCPFSQWTAFKPGQSKLETDRILLKGPAFSDQCEERYQQFKLNMRMSRHRHIIGCEDVTAEICFVAMEIQGQSIGKQ